MKTRPLHFLLLGWFILAGALNPGYGQTDLSQAQSLRQTTLHIGKAMLHTEIAATGPQREIGLMNRTHLADNDGMIFLLPHLEQATFWMKNCHIPLSIAFIDKNGVILDIHDMMAPDPANPVPDNQLPIYRSDTDQVAFALEANLHWFALNGIKPGDKLDPLPATLGTATGN